MVRLDSVWVTGSSNTGKTTRLVEQFCLWMESKAENYSQSHRLKQKALKIPPKVRLAKTEPAVLVFAANNDNRQDLVERLVAATGGRYPIRAKTPLGFFAR